MRNSQNIDFPADIDRHSWIERCDKIHDHFGREKNESHRRLDS
ncbi:MAG: hypothetical protein ACYSUY_15910 [Planctomycetota bacterium]